MSGEKPKLTEEQRLIKRTALFDQAMAYQLEHYGGDGVEEFTVMQRDLMLKVGVDEALIYASIKTGRTVTEENLKFLTKEDLAEWEEAVSEYRKAMGIEDEQQGGCDDPACPNCGSDDIQLMNLGWDKEALAQFVAKAAIAVMESDAGKAAASIMGKKKIELVKQRFVKEIAVAAERALLTLITGGGDDDVIEAGTRSCIDIEMLESRIAIRAIVTKIDGDKLSAKLFFDISHAEHEVTVTRTTALI
jgi:hypothetical protein